jgi:hypothetical protein
MLWGDIVRGESDGGGGFARMEEKKKNRSFFRQKLKESNPLAICRRRLEYNIKRYFKNHAGIRGLDQSVSG